MTPFRLFDPKDPRYVKYKEVKDKIDEAVEILKKARRYRSLLHKTKIRAKKRRTINTPRSSLADTFNMIALHHGLPYRFVENPMNKFYPYFKTDYSDTRRRSLFELSKMYNKGSQTIANRIKKWRPLFRAFTTGADGWTPVKYDRSGIWQAYKKVSPRYIKTILDRPVNNSNSNNENKNQ